MLSVDELPLSRFTVILISRFVIGIREASRRGSCSWASSPSQMSDVNFLSSKLQSFALEDVVPELTGDSSESWDDDYVDKDDQLDVHMFSAGGSVPDQENVAHIPLNAPQ